MRFSRVVWSIFFAAVISGLLFKSSAHSSETPSTGTIKFLDSIEIPENFGQLKYLLREISGISFDEDRKQLFAVSDEGILFNFKIEISNDKIRIENLQEAFPIRLNKNKRPFKDTEDLIFLKEFNGKTNEPRVAIVFEDGPAAGVFDLRGNFQKELDLPFSLKDKDEFPDKNQTIESIAYTKDHGFIFVPQTKISSESFSHHIYATDGMIWSYPYAFNNKHNNTSSMITTKDGKILLLEGIAPSGILSTLTSEGHVTYIREIDLNACNKELVCKIIDFSPEDPEKLTDRFEGIAEFASDVFLIATDQVAGTRLTLVKLIKSN